MTMMGHFERRFQTEGGVPTNHCWRQKSRLIALSCGSKISAVHCLVLSQSTRVTDEAWQENLGVVLQQAVVSRVASVLVAREKGSYICGRQ